MVMELLCGLASRGRDGFPSASGAVSLLVPRERKRRRQGSSLLPLVNASAKTTVKMHENKVWSSQWRHCSHRFRSAWGVRLPQVSEELYVVDGGVGRNMVFGC